MGGVSTETITEAQARAWCVLNPYATMARREFDTLTADEQKRLPYITIMLEYVEGRTDSLCTMIKEIQSKGG